MLLSAIFLVNERILGGSYNFIIIVVFRANKFQIMYYGVFRLSKHLEKLPFYFRTTYQLWGAPVAGGKHMRRKILENAACPLHFLSRCGDLAEARRVPARGAAEALHHL